MEFFFLLLHGIEANSIFSHPFTYSVIQPCHLRWGLGRQAGFITPSPPLLSWRTSSLGISVCGNQLMLHTMCASPLEGFYERSHARACLSLPARGRPPQPAASPGLALWFLTLSASASASIDLISNCLHELWKSLYHTLNKYAFFFFPLFYLFFWALCWIIGSFPHFHVSALIKDRFLWK